MVLHALNELELRMKYKKKKETKFINVDHRFSFHELKRKTFLGQKYFSIQALGCE